MTVPLEQQPDQVRTRAISLVGVGVVAIIIALVAVAWMLVVSPSAAAHLPEHASPLEHGLYDRATGGDDARATAARRLERYEWIDRGARIVRIPIDRAIDAVVADPALIGAGSRPIANEAPR
ncbi:MAG: hypothetical protein ABI846_13870 [Rudaea sp.]